MLIYPKVHVQSMIRWNTNSFDFYLRNGKSSFSFFMSSSEKLTPKYLRFSSRAAIDIRYRPSCIRVHCADLLQYFLVSDPGRILARWRYLDLVLAIFVALNGARSYCCHSHQRLLEVLPQIHVLLVVIDVSVRANFALKCHQTRRDQEFDWPRGKMF